MPCTIDRLIGRRQRQRSYQPGSDRHGCDGSILDRSSPGYGHFSPASMKHVDPHRSQTAKRVAWCRRLRRNPMFKYVLSLTFAVSSTSAATISASATCDGVTTVGTPSAFTLSANCNDGRFSADAQLGAPSFVDSATGPDLTAFNVLVAAGIFGFPPGSGLADAVLDADYVFTVFGGTGDGSFFPCFHVRGIGLAAMAVDGIGAQVFDAPFIGADTCGLYGQSNPFGSPIPFTFGVPQIVHIHMEGSTSGAEFVSTSADASFDGPFEFFDPSGNPISNVTFTLVEVPEPSTASLLSIGWLFFVAVRMISRGAALSRS